MPRSPTVRQLLSVVLKLPALALLVWASLLTLLAVLTLLMWVGIVMKSCQPFLMTSPRSANVTLRTFGRM